jgi:hypothetical protein
VLGITFHVDCSGAAMIFCICGLTVSGTGTLRAGNSRAPVWAKTGGATTTIAAAVRPNEQNMPARSFEAAMLRVMMVSSRLFFCT